MNLFELLEAVKHASPELKKELLDRYYNKETTIINAIVSHKLKSHEERRNHDLER